MSILGLDISKNTFHATVFHHNKSYRRTFGKQPKGFAELHRWLSKKAVACGHACMEATGIYWEQVAHVLHELGWTVSVITPLRIKAFAQTDLARNKTDRYDSWLIARFCQEKRPAAWGPPSPTQRKLQALSRHLEALEQTLQQQRNRLEACVDETVQQSLQEIITQLEHHITKIKQQIQGHIDDTPELKRDQDLLCSITGIGPKTAQKIMAEVPTMTTYPNARKVAAHAGVTPKHVQSGTSIHGKPKLSKIGNARLRKALYVPAISAIQHNPIIKDFANRLRQNGKTEMCIIGAVMRTLLHLSYGVLKHNQPFDPNFLHNA